MTKVYHHEHHLKLTRNNLPKSQSIITLLVILLTTLGFHAVNAQKTAINSGNWNDAAIWSPAGVPSAADQVIIPIGTNISFNVTNGACAGITFQAPTATITANSTLTIEGNNTLTVNGDIVFVYNASGTYTNTLDVGNGTVNTTGNLVMDATGTTTRVRRVLINNGALTCNNVVHSTTTVTGKQITTSGTGSFTANGAIARGASWTFSGNGVLNVRGNFLPLGNEVNFGTATLNFTSPNGGQQTSSSTTVMNVHHINFQNTSGANLLQSPTTVAGIMSLANTGTGTLELSATRLLTINGAIQCNAGSIGWNGTSSSGGLVIQGNSGGSAGVLRFTQGKDLSSFTMDRTGDNASVTISTNVTIGISNSSSTSGTLNLNNGTVTVNNNSTVTIFTRPVDIAAYTPNQSRNNYFALTPGSAIGYNRASSTTNTLIGQTLIFPIGPQGVVSGYRAVEVVAGGATSAVNARFSFAEHSGGAVSATNVPSAGNNRTNFMLNVEMLSGGFGTGAPNFTFHYANSDFNAGAPNIASVHPYTFTGSSWVQQVQTSNQPGTINRIVKSGFALNSGVTSIVLGVSGGTDLGGAPTNFTWSGQGSSGVNNWFDPANWVENAVPNSSAANVTINYTGNNNPSLTSPVSVNTINLSAGTLTVGANGELNMAGNFTVTGGSVSVNVSGVINGTSSATFAMSGTSSYLTSRTMAPWFPSNMSYNIGNTTTVTYGNANTAYILVGQVPQSYGNLVIGSNVTFQDNFPVTVNGNLTINTSRTLSSNSTVTVKGNITNGSLTSSVFSGEGKIVMNGGQAHTVSGGAFSNLDLDDAAGATILGTTTINGTLGLVNGLLTISGVTRLEMRGTFNTTNGFIRGGRIEILGDQGGSAGTIKFSGAAPHLDRITLNRTGANASLTLGSDLTITSTGGLQLTNGTLITGANTFTFTNPATLFTAYEPNAALNNYIGISPGGFFQWNATQAIGTAELKFPIGPAGDVNGFRGVYITPTQSQQVNMKMTFYNHAGGNSATPTNIPANRFNRANYIYYLETSNGSLGSNAKLVMHFRDEDFNLYAPNNDSLSILNFTGAAWTPVVEDQISGTDLKSITRNEFAFFPGENAISLGYEVQEITTAVNELKDDTDVIVFPNPSKGIFRILNKSENIQSVRIFNLFGQVVFFENVQQNELVINADNFVNGVNGVYFVEIKTAKASTLKRIVISR